MARRGRTFLAWVAALAAPASASVGLKPAPPDVAAVGSEVAQPPPPPTPFSGFPAIGDTVDVYSTNSTNSLTVIADDEEVVGIAPLRLASGLVPAEWAHLGPVSIAVHREGGTLMLSRRDDPGLLLAPGDHVDALVTWDDGNVPATRLIVTNAVVVDATEQSVLLRLPPEPASALSPAERLALAQSEGRLVFLLHPGTQQRAPGPAQLFMHCRGG